MEIQPLVSIVLPTYNGEKYLAKSIQSCLNLDYSNWELIVVNDASSDNSQLIIERFVQLDNRIRSVIHEYNRKLPAALNSGFAQAKGQFFTWTSDDNCFKPNAISALVNAIVNNPEVDIVYANYSVIDENDKELGEVEVEDYKNLYFHNCIGACFLYRNEVWRSLGGFDPETFLVEDYDFWLRAAKKFNFHKLSDNLYYYRTHSKSLAERHRSLIRFATMNIINKHFDDLPWISDGGIEKANLFVTFAHLFYEENYALSAISYYVKALCLRPIYVLQNNYRFLIKLCLGKTISKYLKELQIIVVQKVKAEK